MINQDRPIPGENFTSDTKNYPWHQPPEFASVPEALDKMALKLTEPKIARGLMAFAQAGFPLVNLSMMVVMEGVSEGKWTIDMGLLIAGPITKIIEIMCDSYNIEYDVGISEDDSFHTGIFFKDEANAKMASTQAKPYRAIQEQMPEIEGAAEEQSNDAPAQEGSGADEGLAQQGFAQVMSAPPKGKGK